MSKIIFSLLTLTALLQVNPAEANYSTGRGYKNCCSVQKIAPGCAAIVGALILIILSEEHGGSTGHTSSSEPFRVLS